MGEKKSYAPLIWLLGHWEGHLKAILRKHLIPFLD